MHCQNHYCLILLRKKFAYVEAIKAGLRIRNRRLEALRVPTVHDVDLQFRPVFIYQLNYNNANKYTPIVVDRCRVSAAQVAALGPRLHLLQLISQN